MTYEEAQTCKQHLELLKAEIEWDKPIGYQIDLDLAIEALEKQIPKKPILKYKHNKKCPNCGSFAIMEHCARCGQAIDWSEEE